MRRLPPPPTSPCPMASLRYQSPKPLLQREFADGDALEALNGTTLTSRFSAVKEIHSKRFEDLLSKAFPKALLQFEPFSSF